MSPRTAKPVNLTGEQRARLERLWFHYGNYGPKKTPANHSFIQDLLEHGFDQRPLLTKRSPKSARPTPECEAAVDAILASAPAEQSNLRAVPQPVARPQSKPDADLKAMLDDMQRRDRVQRERQTLEPDEPEAA